MRMVFGMALMLGCLACGTSGQPSVYRVGQAIALPSTPSSPCEQEHWLELVPTSAQMPPTQADGLTSNTLTPSGVSVYKLNQRSPLPLSTLLPQLNDPILTTTHLVHVEPVRSRLSIAEGFQAGTILSMVLGTSGLFVGATLLVLSDPDPDGDGLNAGLVMTQVSGALMLSSLLLLIPAAIIKPDDDELELMHVREVTFLSQDHSLSAVKRGVERLNQETRARCAISYHHVVIPTLALVSRLSYVS